MKTLKIYSDAGHGWLAVPRKELIELGIESKISNCSFQRGDMVYLEEDCDMTVYMNSHPEWNKSNVKFKESHTDKRSKIRNYEHFQI